MIPNLSNFFSLNTYFVSYRFQVPNDEAPIGTFYTNDIVLAFSIFSAKSEATQRFHSFFIRNFAENFKIV